MTTRRLQASINPSTVDEDEAGEIYLADYTGGRLYRMVGSSPRANLPLLMRLAD